MDMFTPSIFDILEQGKKVFESRQACPVKGLFTIESFGVHRKE
jgi:hypothetical protein